MNSQMTLKARPGAMHAAQSGVALVVVLLLLIVVTLLGLVAMRGAIMQEKMVSSALGEDLAFQAAEAGLRQGELAIFSGNPASSLPGSGCSGGYCAMTAPGSAPPWSSDSFWKSGSGFKTGTQVGTGNYAVTPLYVIEDIGLASQIGGGAGGASIDFSQVDPTTGKPRQFGGVQHAYRVVSQAEAPNGARARLQSVYVK